LVDRDAITKVIAEEYTPTKDFNQLLEQTSYKLKDTPGSVVNQRNKIIETYSKTHSDEYLAPLKTYVNELSSNPQAGAQLSKAEEILKTEQDWIVKQ
jgi:hypothetical protein